MALGVQRSVAIGLPEAAARRSVSGLGRAWYVCRRKPLGLIGAVIIVVVVGVALLAPVIAPHGPKDFVGRRLEAPSGQFLLGTNSLGQDVLSRTFYGAQISIAVGLTATTLAVGIGTFLGIVSGYFGGWVDMIIQRALEVLASLPALFLTLLIVAIMGKPGTASANLLDVAWQLKGIELAIAAAFMFGNMRVVRAAVIRERHRAYVEAAQFIGASPMRVLRSHILPNVLPYVIVLFSTVIGAVILVEAALSFLGYGVSSGTPSWGIDLAGRNREFFVRRPSMMIGPGVALSLTVMGCNFLGDALRDILDPRLRGTR
jgi:peptide/nickel transport system permease protein